MKFRYIGKIYPDIAWHNKHSVHPHHELIVVLSGVMHVSGQKQQFEVHPGEAVLYPAGVQHWEHSDADEPVESCFIVFEDPTFSGNKILINRDQGTFLRPMAAALYERFITEDSVSFGNEYLALMLKIFRTNIEKKNKDSGIHHKLRTYIYRNLSHPITLSDLAETSGLSKYHFLRQCRRECGKTPVQILWEIRCSEAVSLLKYTDLTIKEIALRTGFSTMAHFSRRIKEFSGKAPGKFRNR